MIINHNCCIKLIPLVIFIYDARSHIHQTVRMCCNTCNKILGSLRTHSVCQGSSDKTPVLITQCGECVVDSSLDMYFEVMKYILPVTG